MSSDYAQDLLQRLGQLAPASILLLDPHGAELVSGHLREHPQCQLDHLQAADPLTELKTRGRYALCLVANTLEAMDKTAAGQLIARLRDLHTERLFVLVPVGTEWQGLKSSWQPTDLIGYGMRPIASYEREGKPLQLFEFDIATYKDTPEWLNARDWAHPERWNKERW